MARLIYATLGFERSASVFYDFDDEEFVVRLYVEGVYSPEADYFTEDRVDACNTADALAETI
jgi:hypothetical protein